MSEDSFLNYELKSEAHFVDSQEDVTERLVGAIGLLSAVVHDMVAGTITKEEGVYATQIVDELLAGVKVYLEMQAMWIDP